MFAVLIGHFHKQSSEREVRVRDLRTRVRKFPNGSFHATTNGARFIVINLVDNKEDAENHARYARECVLPLPVFDKLYDNDRELLIDEVESVLEECGFFH